MTKRRTRQYYVVCLMARIAAFGALIVYGADYALQEDLYAGLGHFSFLSVLWLALMASMAFRLFPSKIESMGCQKEFAARCRPTGRAPEPSEIRQANRGAWWVLLTWTGVNILFFLGYALKWYDERVLLCLAGFYGVCDIVCILFYCPFQSWMMHNRCCTTCRIYNWDYLMLCTPLLAIRSFYTWSACALAAVIFLRWEIVYHRSPERFFESSNDSLKCSQCQEQLCAYKRRLTAAGKRNTADEH